MKKIRTILIGLGAVNLGVLRILAAQHKKIVNDFDLEFLIIAVADSSGVAINKEGFGYQEILGLKKEKLKVKSLKGYRPELGVEKVTSHIQADLLIESSPGNLTNGNPGLEITKQALAHDVMVVLANKAPLVFAFDELHHEAAKRNIGLAFSATVCGGLPVINVLQRDLKLSTLKSFHGILNATTNFVLDELSHGRTLESAIREAQRLGAAEADPSHDINGHDTANKLFIIMKAFAGYSGTINDISVQGIQHITPEMLNEASHRGKKIKLLASAEKLTDQWKVEVKPSEVDAHSFFGTCNGWEMGIELHSDLYEKVSMKNYEADPVGTSAAVVRDAIDLSIRKKSV